MIYTDALQTLIMVVGAVILAIKGEGGQAAVGVGVGAGLSQHPAVQPLCQLLLLDTGVGVGAGM